MANRRLTMPIYQTIIFHLRSGASLRAIEKTKIASRKKIAFVWHIAKEQDWLNPSSIIPCELDLKVFFEKAKKTSPETALTPHKEMVAAWAREGYQASTIYSRLKSNFGYSGSYDSVQRFIKPLKKDDPDLTTPLHFAPGEAAQIDFGYGPKIFNERTDRFEQTHFFVMTLRYSRHQYSELVLHQDIQTWLNCHQNAFLSFGGFPKKLIIDNAKCAVIKAGYYEASLNQSYKAYAKEYGFIIAPCPPRDPQKKGRVESGVNYVKNSFGPLRTFKNLGDANVQLKDWVQNEAGERIHGSTYEKPLVLFGNEEQKALNPLPLTLPDLGIWSKVRGLRTCHVRFQKRYYSIPYKFYDKEMWLKQTPSSVMIYLDDDLIAQHPRLFKPGAYSTNANHLEPKAQAYFERTPTWCLESANSIGISTSFVVEQFLTDPVQDLLRAAQGIIKLGELYGNNRLEKACKRAIAFNSVSHRAIKDILTKGIEDQSDSNPNLTTLSDVYKGAGIYQRTPDIGPDTIVLGHA